MKKMIFVFVVMIAMGASVSVLANSHRDGCYAFNHGILATNIAIQGKHCTGVVGCSCTGFSPITMEKFGSMYIADTVLLSLLHFTVIHSIWI